MPDMTVKNSTGISGCSSSFIHLSNKYLFIEHLLCSQYYFRAWDLRVDEILKKAVVLIGLEFYQQKTDKISKWNIQCIRVWLSTMAKTLQGKGIGSKGSEVFQWAAI